MRQVISEFATISNGAGDEVYPEPARTFVRVLGVVRKNLARLFKPLSVTAIHV